MKTLQLKTANSSVHSLMQKKQQSVFVETNSVQGEYRPRFFDLKDWHISRVDFESIFYENDDPEKELLTGDFSFAYLREDKLRLIKVFDNQNALIPFQTFLERFHLDVKSKNIFKSGKYFSRVFRPTKYGSFFKDLDININDDKRFTGKQTDGLSLISLAMAKSLGWTNAEPNMSAQFTLLFSHGLVKGNCVVSDRIKHDVILYGQENIKCEISLSNGLQYIAIEPLKLSSNLRMDIQSILNLWDLFQADQFLEWAHEGISKYKEDLFAGKLSDYLDDFDEDNVDKYENEKWTLRKAIYHKVDYTKFPGLLRLAWSNYKNAIIKYAESINGQPIFRIPVPGGMRGYIRVDLRNHDEDGNFLPSIQEDVVEIDNYGNVWFHPNGIEEVLEILGGADMDDSLAVIPIEGNKAVIFRNPNQFGEYIIRPIKGQGVSLTYQNKLKGSIPQKELTKIDLPIEELPIAENKLLSEFLKNRERRVDKNIKYNLNNILRTFSRISSNSSNIGRAANAEMIRSAIRITDKDLFELLLSEFTWDLERIIDSTVKEGTDSDEDLSSVVALMEFVVESEVPIPKCFINRIPERLRENANTCLNHPIDELLEAIKYIIEETDKEILGRGTVSKGNRIPGKIDNIDIPLIELGRTAINNGYYDLALSMMKGYNRSMAIVLEKFNSDDSQRSKKIDEVQREFLNKLADYSIDERVAIVNVMAYEIYRSTRSVHDSILWIKDIENLRGTASDTIIMLANNNLAMHIKRNGSLTRYKKLITTQTPLKSIRLWSKQPLDANNYVVCRDIMVENRLALIGTDTLNLGDECSIPDGLYSVKQVVQSASRRNQGRLLKNSITVYLQ